MPIVRNRTAVDLNCRLGLTIPAHGEIEVTAEEAAELAGGPLFEVLPDPAPPAPPAPPTPEPDSQELQDAEAELEAAQEHLAEIQHKESN